MNNHIFNMRKQRLGDEKIINSPTNAALPGVADICPPRVLNTVWIEMTVDIHKAMIEELLHPGTLLGQKTGCLLVRFWIPEVNWHMGRVKVPGDDHISFVGVQRVTHGKQMGIKVKLVVEAFFAALTV